MKTLIVEAVVRYWEDATVNGVVDTDGALIPLRGREIWAPIIDLETGRILDWPQGTTADIHYKVCDAGSYWLGDERGQKFQKWRGDYVPGDLLCIGDEGYGDYIIMQVDGAGLIQGWRNPTINPDQWQALVQRCEC